MKILHREQLFFQIISKCGGITKKFLNENNMNDKRIRQLENEGYLERKKFQKNVNGKLENRYAYAPGKKGKEYIEKKGYASEIQYFNGYEHQEKSEKALKSLLENGIEVKNIFSEVEQTKKFHKEISNARKSGLNFKINDFAYVDNGGNLHSLEIENNYSNKLISKHKNYAENVLGVKYEYIK